MTRESGFKRRVRERMTKTGESYAAARAQLDQGGISAALHVTSGDSARHSLRDGGVREPILAWRDVLHEGPVPPLPPAELAEVRARFLAEAFGGGSASILQGLLDRDRALARAARGMLILWFDADLYDQLQLLQVLDRLNSAEAASATLISIAEYVGRAHFGGLGELSGAELAALERETAQAVGTADLRLAARVWRAFTGSDPQELVPFTTTRSAALRHLGEAIERLLQEYPWVSDGLSLTERRVLRAIAPGGANQAGVFRIVWAAERRPFAGDTVVSLVIDRLAGAGLVEVLPDSLRLSVAGRDVLEGRADRADYGMDRWIGGVHLTSPPGWRWDPRAEAVVSG